MKNISILVLLILSTTIYSQDKKKFKIEYINMTSLSILKNTESYLTSYTSGEERSNKGFSFDLNTIQGIRFFDHIAISVGMSLDWNIDKTFLSTPVIFDLRVFSGERSSNRLFAYLQSGKNIKWSNSFNGNGTTAKMGFGVISRYDEHISYYLDLNRKSKEIEIEKNKDNGFYRTNGFGISIGVIF